jgi:two-component system LytT family response regulator
MTLETFTSLERRIAPDVICRIHKSYMVALDKIESIEGGRVTLPGMSLPVSGTYRDRFLALIRR